MKLFHVIAAAASISSVAGMYIQKPRDPLQGVPSFLQDSDKHVDDHVSDNTLPPRGSKDLSNEPLLPQPKPKKPSGAEIAVSRLVSSLETMQDQFFSKEIGYYPSSNDWTSAMIQTHLSATLQSILQSSPTRLPRNESLSHYHRFFTHLVGFFHGQHWQSLLLQAYDDMLWVCLGWISSVQLLAIDQDQQQPPVGVGSPYYKDWLEPFAARARLFYEAAEKGWDEDLCRGGMIWSPWLLPYKNAITNELFISASVEMFLYYPPHLNADGERNATYLEAAIRAWNWLKKSNMTNEAGLFVDGFHVSNLGKKPKWWNWKRWVGDGGYDMTCDQRSEDTYTYNQGVLLSGLHGLYLATGDEIYLDHAHRLVSSVIKSEGKPGGLMRNGIIEERCDSSARCSQNGQTFKGIFFHHLTLFCDQNALFSPVKPDSTPSPYISSLHYSRCVSYHPFILANANAAWRSRSDFTGVVGGWWSAPDVPFVASSSKPEDDLISQGHHQLDTPSEPDYSEYLKKRSISQGSNFDYKRFNYELLTGKWDLPADPRAIDNLALTDIEKAEAEEERRMEGMEQRDLNDRGRGRTVETQSGGVAVFRAAWQVVWQNGW